MKKIIVLLVLLLSSSQLIFSIDTVSTKYFPRKAGNSWTYYRWTYEVEWNAADYPSGVYFYTLQTNSFKQTKKMVLVK